MKLSYSHLSSPVGTLTLLSAGRGLRGVDWETPDGTASVPEGATRDDSAFAPVREQLAEYFSGDRTSFDLELDPVGTEFQLRVWEALRRIPYGSTISYGELARRIGNPAASRAVGLANGRNPISIIVPCHRVIGANGSLTGFGGGLPRKQILLDLEVRHRAGAAVSDAR